MKNLVLICYAYPYDPPKEQFLENEIDYLSAKFGKIFIIPVGRNYIHSTNIRKLPENAHLINIQRRNIVIEVLASALYSFFHPELYIDVLKIIKKRTINKKLLKTFLQYHFSTPFKSFLIGKVIRSLVKNSKDEYVLYSYWFSSLAYTVTIIKKSLAKHGVSLFTISRVHGYSDLFITREFGNLYFCSGFIKKHLDKLISISETGVKYLRSIGFDNIELSRLGVVRQNVSIVDNRVNNFEIVSCSNLVSVKRVNLMIEALSLIDEIKIKWTHFGDGILMNKLTELCGSKLKKNVNWKFMGNIKNDQIINYYLMNKPSVFLNTSIIEGIPVSAMEAISCGIPLLCTDVGGNSEICLMGGNGLLLKSDVTPLEIKQAIMTFYNMDSRVYLRYCQESLKLFYSQYSNESNYNNFSKLLGCDDINEV